MKWDVVSVGENFLIGQYVRKDGFKVTEKFSLTNGKRVGCVEIPPQALPKGPREVL